tara:strand:+ start:74 stop:277 length:204 start_codon:yes stop_codon:yes gene_type:complete
MSKKIIYQTADGGVAVITPCPNVSIEFCVRDVPTGLKYKIVDESDILSDRTFRNAWEVTPDETWSTK